MRRLLLIAGTLALLAGGAAIEGSGWGLRVYHHDADGKWRVARDSWGSDQPVAAK